jgi:hypothetical protein
MNDDQTKFNSGVENNNFRVGVTNKNGETVYNSYNKKLSVYTLTQLYNYIESLDLEPEIKEKVKQAAGRYPQQALPSFRKNIKNHIHNIKKNNSKKDT